MADPAGTHSDGVLIWGTQISAINSVNYILDTISTDADTKVLESMNEVGVPNKQVFIEQVITGSAVCQLAANNTPAPPIGANFNIFPIGANHSNASEGVTFLVKKVAPAYQQDGETKVSIDFRKKLN